METNKKSCKSSFNATAKSQKNRLALEVCRLGT